MPLKTKDLCRALALPGNAISYRIHTWLHRHHPERCIEFCEDTDVKSFASAGHCHLSLSKRLVPQFEMNYWGQDRPISREPQQAWFDIRWGEHKLELLAITFKNGGHCAQRFLWILGPSQEVVSAFFKAAMVFNDELDEQILVFTGGHFSKDTQLYQNIQSSQFDNLVLSGDLKTQLQQDCQQFFASEELYRSHGVPWKRGYLLLGPPGNGKSHAIKALVNTLKRPCLYVQSFKSQYQTDHQVMRSLFERARRIQPCILVLEDLDSLLNDGNRSFFLNELDGFANNHGLLTLASTNHPERLDPAILDRPSRFDRKFTFALPEEPERLAYLSLWNQRLEAPLRLSPQGLTQVAQATANFSYAYLKELVLSSMMRWMGGSDCMDTVMLEVVQPLLLQLAQPAQADPYYGPADEED